MRDALILTGHAPQASSSLKQRPELAGLSGPRDTIPESEDCLTLNVWTRGIDVGGKRPVMVWYHGGAFSYGSANTPRLDGTNLAAHHDLVVVTVNQRLNILGHLHLAELGGGEYANSGNAGTLDMVAALQWVRDNIARFGPRISARSSLISLAHDQSHVARAALPQCPYVTEHHNLCVAVPVERELASFGQLLLDVGSLRLPGHLGVLD